MQSVVTHMKKSETELRNVQNPNQQYLEKCSEICTRSWRSRKSHQNFGIEAMQTNILMLGLFMSSSMKAAILDQMKLRIWQCTRTRASRKSRTLLGITQKLVSDHIDVKPIESTASLWTRSRLSHRQVIKWTKSKGTRILRLCLVSGKDVTSFRSKPKMGKSSGRFSIDRFLSKNYWVLMENQLSSSEIFTGRTSLQILQEIQSDLRSWNDEPEFF